MKQCFAYTRVSTVKQGEGVSLEAQRDAISAYAARHNLEIVKWFEEKETAAKSGRPVFNTMLKELYRGDAQGLIIHKIDRSARNFADWAKIGDLADTGCDIHFATESLDFRSRGGRLTADIQAVIAADYIRNLREESRKGMLGRLKQGVYPYQAPLGYCNAGGGNSKTLDPVRAPLIRELFEYYLTGNYSILSLSIKMAERGLETRGNKPVSKCTIEHILQNSFYCGLMRNGRTKEVYPGKHEPIISVAEFEKITAIKSGRYRKKTTRHMHLFRGLFLCEKCHNLLTPEKQKSYVYYRCHTSDCIRKSLREDVIETSVIRSLRSTQFSCQQEQEIERDHSGYQQNTKSEEIKRSISLRIDQVKARLDKLTDLLLDGRIDQVAHDNKREELIFKLKRLEEEELQLASNQVDEDDFKKFLELMKNVARLYISATYSEKRIIVEQCFSNRRWDGQNVHLELSELVQTAQDRQCVRYGGPCKDTIRTFVDKLWHRSDTD